MIKVTSEDVMIYQVKARDTKGNTTIMHEVFNDDEAKELEEWERLRNPTHYIFTDVASIDAGE